MQYVIWLENCTVDCYKRSRLLTFANHNAFLMSTKKAVLMAGQRVHGDWSREVGFVRAMEVCTSLTKPTSRLYSLCTRYPIIKAAFFMDVRNALWFANVSRRNLL